MPASRKTDPLLVTDLARFEVELRLISIDPGKNRYRSYTLTWQPSLFGGGAF